MPGTGVDLHRRLRELAVPTILIAAYPEDRIRARALADGVISYLSKPFSEDTLLGCIRSALDRANPSEVTSDQWFAWSAAADGV